MDCKIMGIVNVTPDSFSDGGKFCEPKEAIRRAKNLIDEGADIIDIGGESTRPDATPIGWEEEWRRIGEVVAALAPKATVSVDTYHPETAERALAAGAGMINCVFREPLEKMFALLRGYPQAEIVVPFRPGDDLAAAIPEDLRTRVYLDPMIGFGTTREEDLELLKAVGELAKVGRVLVGASRKRIVKKLTGEKVTGKNLGGNLAIALFAAANGASVVRVHDVRETAQAIKVWTQLR